MFFFQVIRQILKIEELNHQIVELNKKKDSENLECNRLNQLNKFFFLFSRQVIDAFKTINCNFEIYYNEIGKLNEQIKIIKLQLIEKNSEKYF
jgi:hypothetical protein